jgi:hypothetical protein
MVCKFTDLWITLCITWDHNHLFRYFRRFTAHILSARQIRPYITIVGDAVSQIKKKVIKNAKIKSYTHILIRCLIIHALWKRHAYKRVRPSCYKSTCLRGQQTGSRTTKRLHLLPRLTHIQCRDVSGWARRSKWELRNQDCIFNN